MRGARLHNLPAPSTLLIGRERETAALQNRLRQAHVRLLTLVGPPGVGKTRLGLEVAGALLEEFEQGVFFVPLSPVRDPGLVVSAIAQAFGIHEVGRRLVRESLVAALRERHLLLVLDNFEHVVAAAPLVAELITACPRLKLLATSRAPLHVYGEHEFPVPPLALPDLQHLPAVEELGRVAAVALFLERAQAVRPDFGLTSQNAAAVAEICVRLDGVPLGIELAAARSKVLSPQAILDRLGGRLTLLTGSAQTWPGRHRPLREAIDWSYDLLDQAEQTLLRRLAVFVGGWRLEAAEAVCGDEVLEVMSRLVDQSLVVAEEWNGETRYRFLETIHEYGGEKLREAGEEAPLRDRHLAWFEALAERAELELWGPRQASWLERLEGELNNLRAALDWCKLGLERGETSRGEAGLRLGGALHRYWGMRGHAREARERLAHLLALAPGRTPGRAKALIGAGYLAFVQGDHPGMGIFLEEGLALARELGDTFAVATALVGLGTKATLQAEFEAADCLLEESLRLWGQTGFRAGLAMALFWRGEVARLRGEYGRAAALLEQGLGLTREHGDIYGAAYHLNSLGYVELARENPERAAALQRESVLLWRELGDRYGVAQGLAGLGCAASARGDTQRAARLLGVAESVEVTLHGAPPAWRPDRDRALTAVRTDLGEDRFAAAWATGRAMPLEQALDDALAATEPERPIAVEPGGQSGARRLEVLSHREREVAALIARGLTNRQVAAELLVSERTADAHLEHIRAKLELHTRAQIAAWAVEHGLARLTS